MADNSTLRYRLCFWCWGAYAMAHHGPQHRPLLAGLAVTGSLVLSLATFLLVLLNTFSAEKARPSAPPATQRPVVAQTSPPIDCSGGIRPLTSSHLHDLIARAANTRVFTELVPTKTPFPFVLFTCRSPCFCDLCTTIADHGLWSPTETLLFHHLLKGDKCSKDDAIVVDVGANVGYFTVLSAQYNCTVVAVEPSPSAATFTKASMQVNGLLDRLQLYQGVISGARGTAALKRTAWADIQEVVTEEANIEGTLSVKSFLLEDVVNKDVELLKVDTEGHELSVFHGAESVWSKHRVHNILIEVKKFNTKRKRELLQRLMIGFRASHVYNFRDHMDGIYQRLSSAQDLLAINLGEVVFDVTKIIKERQDDVQFLFEDFLLSQDPLPDGMFSSFTPNVQPAVTPTSVQPIIQAEPLPRERVRLPRDRMGLPQPK